MVGAVTRPLIATVARAIVGIISRETAQPHRRAQLSFDDFHNFTCFLTFEQWEGQTQRENLIRAQRGVLVFTIYLCVICKP
jgi:hypothetical protein